MRPSEDISVGRSLLVASHSWSLEEAGEPQTSGLQAEERHSGC